MKILGVSSFYHDSSAALLIDGFPVAAVQEERFTRKKNDSSFPYRSIQYCLEKANSQLHEINGVVFYEKPLLKMDRLIDTHLRHAPFYSTFFVDTIQDNLQKNLLFRSQITNNLKKIDNRFDESCLFFSEHHLSHAASAYFPSPFDSATILSIDGLGEWCTTAVSIGHGDSLEIRKEIHFPHSLGLFYSAMTAFCGFKVNSGEYKLMGLAPYGRPIWTEKILNNIIHLSDDGSFSLNQDFFNFQSTKKMFSSKMEEFFQIKPRTPETFIETPYMDIAASTQKALNISILNLTKNLAKRYSSENLCLAGGVALNCVTNTEILKQGLYKNIWIQPASGDAGSALGAAFALHSLHFKNKRYKKSTTDLMSYSYLGTNYNDEEIENKLAQCGIRFSKHQRDELIKIVALFLTQGLSIGWFQGRMEFGPRALGNRSILADPRPKNMQKILNQKIKFRESFRPFAPVIMEEKLSDWFESNIQKSPYMLFVDYLLPKHRLDSEKIPAVIHLDHSARIQTVNRNQNPLLYDLLNAFYEKTGIPMLVNTSFNVRGEPIVESPQDAINCFFKTNLDLLVIGSFLVEKHANLIKNPKE